MSARARRPTDGAASEIRDPARLPIRIGVAASGADAPSVATGEADADARAAITPIEHATPTCVDARLSIEPGTPTELTARPERSEPIRVISMKQLTTAEAARAEERRVPLHVQLRRLAEVAGRNDTPARLGHLAPPRDPRRARARRVRGNLAWAGVALALACGIALAIWLVAGR